MKHLLAYLVTIYQKILSPDQGLPKKLGLTRGGNCGFIPTCSEYTKQAILKHGSLKGVVLGVKRIVRCHPWQTDFYDPVP